MDKRFLDKVVDQLVSETEIYHDEEEVSVPFPPFSHTFPFLLSFLLVYSYVPFTKHCRDVYGLNIHEIKYVWDEYGKIIKDKINNG